MSDAYNPEAVGIELGGKNINIIFDLDVLATIEEVSGISPWDEGFWNPFTPKKLRAVVYAVLLRDDQEITLKDAGRVVPISKFKEVSEKLAEAFDLATGVLGDDKSPDPTVAGAGPNGSSPSGRSQDTTSESEQVNSEASQPGG